MLDAVTIRGRRDGIGIGLPSAPGDLEEPDGLTVRVAEPVPVRLAASVAVTVMDLDPAVVPAATVTVAV